MEGTEELKRNFHRKSLGEVDLLQESYREE